MAAVGEIKRAFFQRRGRPVEEAVDLFHVACALELGLPSFLTFDERQRRLARAVGLKTVVLRT